jgi:hypothetical protein
MLSDLEGQVLQHIDPNQVVEWTRELMRIPSVYRPHTGEAELLKTPGGSRPGFKSWGWRDTGRSSSQAGPT